MKKFLKVAGFIWMTPLVIIYIAALLILHAAIWLGRAARHVEEFGEEVSDRLENAFNALCGTFHWDLEADFQHMQFRAEAAEEDVRKLTIASLTAQARKTLDLKN